MKRQMVIFIMFDMMQLTGIAAQSVTAQLMPIETMVLPNTQLSESSLK